MCPGISGEEKDQEVQAAAARRAGRHLADAAGRRRPRAGVSQMHRVFSLPGCLPRPARSSHARRIYRTAFLRFTRPPWKCIRSTPKIGSTELREAHGIGYCNITKCCTKVCPENIEITDNGIIPLKERVVDEFYDPLGWIWGKVKRVKRESRENNFGETFALTLYRFNEPCQS